VNAVHPLNAPEGELEELRRDVVRLGAMVVEAMQMATAALLDTDLVLGEKVLEGDRAIDELARSIEDRAYEFLASRQPGGEELRTAVALIKVVYALGRTGDLMINVTKASRHLYPHPLDPQVRGLVDRMREQATVQMHLAIDAFADMDPVRASALKDVDDAMDALQRDLFRTIFTTSTPDEVGIQRAVQMALVGRFFERAADHAVSIGERVSYIVEGRH
jgi:phosphate transport system protein